jgi:hypothetical protein
MRIVSACALATALLTACTARSHPEGWKPVDFRGERIYVPSTWQVNTKGSIGAECMVFGGQLRSVVVEVQEVPPRPTACGGPAPPAVDTGAVVALEQMPSPPRTPPPGTHPTTVHGVHGYLSTRLLSKPSAQEAGRFVGVFIDSHTGVVVAVGASTLNQVQQILANVRRSHG